MGLYMFLTLKNWGFPVSFPLTHMTHGAGMFTNICPNKITQLYDVCRPLYTSTMEHMGKPIQWRSSLPNGSPCQEHQAPVTHLVAGGADHAEWLLSGDVAGAVPWIGRETGEKRRKIRENVGKHLGESEEPEETDHRT